MDPKQRWCPTWIVRNYEKHNNVIHGLPVLSALPEPRPEETTAALAPGEVPPFPHANAYCWRFKFQRSYDLVDLSTESGQTPQGSFSAV